LPARACARASSPRSARPADCIAEAARKGGYDLMMMGSHGHGSLGNLVLGSVATKVLASAVTPVLLIR
jgi:nucleotide-binding universal stress UspA family protein